MKKNSSKLVILFLAIGFFWVSIDNALDAGESMTLKLCLWSLSGAIIGGFVVEWFIRKGLGNLSISMNRKLLNSNIDLGEEVLGKDVMNHFRGLIADGGVGYILTYKFVFIPHKLNLSRKTIVIMFSDMVAIEDYRVLGLHDTGLKIRLQSGQEEKFVVDKTSDFYRKLLSMINQAD